MELSAVMLYWRKLRRLVLHMPRSHLELITSFALPLPLLPLTLTLAITITITITIKATITITNIAHRPLAGGHSRASWPNVCRGDSPNC
mmetsp:Transcript_82629/g.164901  ORF Transcript_82629/g.164901 Transcript_82629/m.164901 type:complete len:89 (+) Transcript_82629:1375-1641(+)